MFLELQQKLNHYLSLTWFPALTLQVFVRRKTGFRQLSPGAILTMTYIMLLYAGAWQFLGIPSGGMFQKLVRPARAEQFKFSVEPGFDAPLPSNLRGMNYAEQQAWSQKHRISDPKLLQEQQAQFQREQQEFQKEAAAAAESALFWANLQSYIGMKPMYLYAIAFLVWGMMQRRVRWRGILKGEMWHTHSRGCLLYTSPSPRDRTRSRMPSSA